MQSHAARDVPALTGLRGLAALVVVMYHYLQAPTLASGNIRSPFSGYLGVELFFILSGYLMALNYGPSFEQQQNLLRAYFSFLGKRFARVYPLYAVMTIIVFVAWLIALYPAHLRYRILVVNLLLAQQLGPGLMQPGLGDSILGGAWSISTEVGAYIVFPFLYFASCRTGKNTALAVLVLSVLIVSVLATIPSYLKPQQLPSQGPLDIWSGWNLWPLVRCLSEFTLGLLVLRFTRAGLPKILDGNAAGLAIVTGLIISLVLPRLDLLSVFLVALLVAHAGSSLSTTARFFSSKPAIWLGDISYSIYILHVSFIMVTYERPFSVFKTPWFHDRYWLVLITTLVMLFTVSRLAFEYIERPSRRLLRSIFDLPKRPITEDPSIP